MAIRLTVADDSKMSRKSVIRAIPAGWDVEITEAQNGKEAVENYNNGLADVMFWISPCLKWMGYKSWNTFTALMRNA